jgi:hypothetical protein
MSIEVNITNITGQTPFDIYICQSDGTGCIYIKRINTTSDSFIIPAAYNQSTSYLLKIVDSKGCIITQTKTL